MGRLPAVNAWAMSLSLWLSVAMACDSGQHEAAEKSRVQAVPAAPKSAGAPAPEAPQLAAEPVAPKPRTPLCGAKLDAPGEPFRPQLPPAQMSGAEGVELPESPLAGRRFTWVNFWAAWCVPCKEELPLLLEWRERLRSQLDFVFVSFDDDERQLRDFLERQPASGLSSSYWLPDGAARRAWLDALGLESEPELPLQLLLDARGRVRCRVQGAVEARDVETLERLLAAP